MLRIYAYKNCDTCRKALKFLRSSGVAFKEIAIRETPPSQPELRSMLAALDGSLRKLFNTSGHDYRTLGLAEKLPGMPEADAIDLLASNGNLVKRPFTIGHGVHLIGFDEALWRAAFP